MTRRTRSIAWAVFAGCGAYVLTGPTGASWSSVVVALATVLSGSVLIWEPDGTPVTEQDITGDWPSWSTVSQGDQ